MYCELPNLLLCSYLDVLLRFPPPCSQTAAVTTRPADEAMATAAPLQPPVHFCLLFSAHARQLSTGNKELEDSC